MVKMEIEFQGPTSQLLVFKFGSLGLKVTGNFLMTRSVNHSFVLCEAKESSIYILFSFYTNKTSPLI